MLRNAALCAAAALTVGAAIIAAGFLDTTSAQSDDETSGWIVARRLDDGRTEFGWQPRGGARVLPRLRQFPANVEHNRWLNSSPIEVEGIEIGRINVCLLDDERIEFAFTPTTGERIYPGARHFPAEARPNRWLRSTEITIPALASGFTAFTAGTARTCGLRGTGEVLCWGYNSFGQTDMLPR